MANKNLPQGSHFPDGVRVGPYYDYIQGNNSYSATNPLSTAPTYVPITQYQKYGKGILQSPQNTYTIVPYNTAAGNIVVAAVASGAGYLTLAQGTQPGATKLLSNPKGLGPNPTANTMVQFDWPRVVGITVQAGVALASGITVTVFGYDYYGFPMQQTYVIPSGTYTAPGNNFIGSTGVNDGNGGTVYYTMLTPAKAFYGITAIYCSAATTPTISVQTTNIFGLPYRIIEYSDVMNFSWGSSNMKDQVGQFNSPVVGNNVIPTAAAPFGVGDLTYNVFLTPVGGANVLYLNLSNGVTRTSFQVNASTTNSFMWTMIDGGQRLMRFGGSGTQTGTSSDPRGLFMLPDPLLSPAWDNAVSTSALSPSAFPPNGSRRAIVTPYIFGADTFQNQLAANEQIQGSGTVPALDYKDLYGELQYYTGVPA